VEKFNLTLVQASADDEQALLEMMELLRSFLPPRMVREFILTTE
jgi:hypothetical protein